MEVGQQEEGHIGCSREEETAISLVMKVNRKKDILDVLEKKKLP